MTKLKSFFAGAAAVLYFVLVMWWVLLLLLFLLLVLFMDMRTVLASGFSAANTAPTLISVLGLFIGLSLVIPPFRLMYSKLPWLFPYVKILYLDALILCAALLILNFGYEVRDEARHALFFKLMILQILVCRVGMCIYFHKKPVTRIGGMTNGGS